MTSAFLCHSSHDKEFVRELHRRLIRDGVSCFFDEASIEWGENWVLALEKGLDTCKDIVVVLSPNFIHSEWAKIERTSIFADDPEGFKRKIRPILLQECHDLVNFPRFLRPIQHIDVSTATLFDTHYPKICKTLGGTPGKDHTLPDNRKTLPAVCPLPKRSIMSHRSLEGRFAGRVSDLWKLHNTLRQSGTTIIHGIGVITGTGGLGKTQLAIEYAHRFCPEYPGGIFWIEADQGIENMVSRLSRALNISHHPAAQLDEQLSALWQALNQPVHSLIILDNFPEKMELKPWLSPFGHIHVLVTTRSAKLTQYPNLGLDVLTPDESIQLLNSGKRTHDKEKAAKLAHEVGHLPLALELLRDLLDRDTSLSVTDILNELQHGNTISLLDEFSNDYQDKLPSGHEKSILKTFELSWNLASKEAQQILQIMAQLAPTSVPRQLLRKILNLPEITGYSDPLRPWLNELKHLSLTSEDTDSNPYAHRLILGFVHHYHPIDPTSNKEVYTTLCTEMHRVWNEHDRVGFKDLESVIPHAEAICYAPDFTQHNERYIDLLGAIAKHHRNHGRYSQAKHFHANALQQAEHSFESGHPSIAIRQSNLALVLKDLGELTEARELLRKALQSDELWSWPVKTDSFLSRKLRCRL